MWELRNLERNETGNLDTYAYNKFNAETKIHWWSDKDKNDKAKDNLQCQYKSLQKQSFTFGI